MQETLSEISMMKSKSYSELSQYSTFEDRFNYLKLPGCVGESVFGFDRWINQQFYKSRYWQDVRDEVIVRDNGCDLGVPGYELYDYLLIHHINPMSPDAIKHGEDWIIDPEYLITTSRQTHNAIHYGASSPFPRRTIKRTRGDTKLW